ncbi:uncharacterized protein LOC144018699 isoform X2 [Festucalex cinctus]
MLKELVRERLIAAADEIFGLFETTIASYEEQLRRARDESERHRRQLQAVCKTQVVVSLQDVQQMLGRGCFNLEREDPQNDKEEEKVDVSKFPPTGVSVKTEDEAPECSRLHPRSPNGGDCGGPPPDKLLAPLSDSDNLQETLRSDADCEGDDKQSKCSEEETSQSDHEHSLTPQKHVAGVLHANKAMHRGVKPFSCSICHKGLTQRSSLRRHMRLHTGEKPFSCSTCGKVFSRKKYMAVHMRIHSEQPFLCSLCKKTFALKETLISHMSKHAPGKRFTCSVCEKKFSRKTDLVCHARTHTGERPFTCSVCGNSFSRKYHMKTHMRVHTGEKPFSCSNCGKVYSRKLSMVVHMRKHTGEKPFGCSVCGEKFARWNHLMTHTETHKSGE